MNIETVVWLIFFMYLMGLFTGYLIGRSSKK